MSCVADMDVHLLGRFEVQAGDRIVRGFESRKVRVLFAYLVLGDDQPEPSRSRVAALLWPDLPEAAGRRNLRQALYNIRQTLAAAGVAHNPVVSGGSGTLTLSPEIDVAVDVLTFEQLVARGLNGGGPLDAEALASAIPMYRGDFLDGLYLEEGLALEEWLLLRRERLRDLAIDGVRALVVHYRGRGEYTQAITAARRWLELDPLSEHGHRTLMELYARAGRRSRALAQYESCVHMLRVELGVEPGEETTKLLEAILSEQAAETGGLRPVGESRPTIPLVGRREEYARLRESWQAVSEEAGGRIVLVEGEAGVGKTRLVKTFIHGVVATEEAGVLIGRSFPAGWLPVALGAVADLVRSARGGHPEALSAVLADDPTLDRWVTTLLDEGSERDARSAAAPPGRTSLGPGQALGKVVQRWGEACCGQPDDSSRLILLFENLQWADASTLEAVRDLTADLARSPVWIVGTVDPGVRRLTADDVCDDAGRSRLDIVQVDRVEASALREVGESLLPEPQARYLNELLTARSGGLPLAVTELVNLLCDEGLLAIGEDGWVLKERPPDESTAGLDTLDDIMARRIAALHDSSRRVAVAASVMGQRFDVEALAQVVNEPLTVLEPVLHELLKRGFVRFLPTHWFESRRERDLVLWGEGARRGVFQLGSRRLSGALLRSLPQERKTILYRRVARTLQEAGPGRIGTGYAESVAGQLLAAGDDAEALPWVARACDRAVALGAFASAKVVGEVGLDLADRVAELDPRWTSSFRRALEVGGGRPVPGRDRAGQVDTERGA